MTRPIGEDCKSQIEECKTEENLERGNIIPNMSNGLYMFYTYLYGGKPIYKNIGSQCVGNLVLDIPVHGSKG